MPSKFEVVFLHIGLGKTGSTSIQTDLAANAELLERDHNLYFPTGFSHAAESAGNHSILLRTLFSDCPDVRRRLAAIGLVSDADIEAYNDMTLATLKRGIESTSASKLLLSAESVGHFRKPHLDELLAWLHTMSKEVRVVACLRHPMHALSSEIQQRLSIGECLRDMYANPPAYRIRRLVNRVSGAFGSDNLLFYSFDSATRHPAGLANFLLKQIGINANLKISGEGLHNSSISHEGALLFDAFNRLHPILIDGRRNPKRHNVDIDLFKQIPGRKFRAPDEVYRRVEARVGKDVTWLEETMGITLEAHVPDETQGYMEFSDAAIEHLAIVMAETNQKLSGIFYETREVTRAQLREKFLKRFTAQALLKLRKAYNSVRNWFE